MVHPFALKAPLFILQQLSPSPLHRIMEEMEGDWLTKIKTTSASKPSNPILLFLYSPAVLFKLFVNPPNRMHCRDMCPSLTLDPIMDSGEVPSVVCLQEDAAYSRPMTHSTFATLWNKRNLADLHCNLQAIKQIQMDSYCFHWKFLIGTASSHSISLK